MPPDENTKGKKMYLTAQECAELLHVKRATFVNQTCKQEGFPKPFVISPRKRFWPKADVHEFIRRRRQK